MIFWLTLVVLIYFLPIILVWFLENKLAISLKGSKIDKNKIQFNSKILNSENSNSEILAQSPSLEISSQSSKAFNLDPNSRNFLGDFISSTKFAKSWILAISVLVIFVAYWLFHKGILGFSWNNFALHFAGGVAVGLIFEYLLANLPDQRKNLVLKNPETQNKEIIEKLIHQTDPKSEVNNLEISLELENQKNEILENQEKQIQENSVKASKDLQNLPQITNSQSPNSTNLTPKNNSQNKISSPDWTNLLQNSFRLQFLTLYFLVSGLGVGNELLEFFLDQFSAIPFTSSRTDTWFDLTANTCGAVSVWLILYFVKSLWKKFKK